MYSSAIDDFESFIYNSLKKNDEKYHAGNFIPDGLIVLGNTGSGKSTFINFLMNNQLKVLINEGKIVIDSDSNPKICATKLAGTTFPFPYLVDELMMNAWDTPGYSDTSTPNIEILNGVSIKALLGRLKGKVKIAYVIEEGKLDGKRGKEFIEEFELFYNYLEDFSKVENSLFLVISKGGVTYVDEYGTTKAIMDILNNHGYLAENKYKNIKKILQKIVKDQRIFQFIRPLVGENVYVKNSRSTLINLIKKISFVNAENVKVNHILSNDAQKYLVEAKNFLKQEIDKIFPSINSFFKSKIDTLVEENDFLPQKINSLEFLKQSLNKLPQNLENYGSNNQLIEIKFFEDQNFQNQITIILKKLYQKIEFLGLFRTYDNKIEILRNQYFSEMLSACISYSENKLNQLKIFWQEINEKNNEISNKADKVITNAYSNIKGSLNHLEKCIKCFSSNNLQDDNSLKYLAKFLNELENGSKNGDLDNFNALYKNLNQKQLIEIEKNLILKIKPHFLTLQKVKEDQQFVKYARNSNLDIEIKRNELKEMNGNLGKQNSIFVKKNSLIKSERREIYHMKLEEENNFYQKESMNDVKMAEKMEGLQNQVMILKQELMMGKQIIHDLNVTKEVALQEKAILLHQLSIKNPSKHCVIF